MKYNLEHIDLKPGDCVKLKGIHFGGRYIEFPNNEIFMIIAIRMHRMFRVDEDAAHDDRVHFTCLSRDNEVRNVIVNADYIPMIDRWIKSIEDSQ